MVDHFPLFAPLDLLPPPRHQHLRGFHYGISSLCVIILIVSFNSTMYIAINHTHTHLPTTPTHSHILHAPSQVLTALRSQLEFPAHFTERLPNEVVSIVRLLLATDPTKRPTALEVTTLKTLQSLEKKVRKSKREYIPVL